MDSGIRQDDNDVDAVNSVSNLGRWDVVSKMHISLSEHQDGALIHNFNAVRKGWIQRLKMAQVGRYQERYFHLNGKLWPEESSTIDRTHGEQNASGEEQRWVG